MTEPYLTPDERLTRRLAAESRARAAACRRDHFPTWRVTVRNGNHSAFSGGRFTPSPYSALWCGSCGRAWRSKAPYVARVPDYTQAEAAQRARRLDLLAPKLSWRERRVTVTSLVLRGDQLRPLGDAATCLLCALPLTGGLAVPTLTGTDEVPLHDACAADVRARQHQMTRKENER